MMSRNSNNLGTNADYAIYDDLRFISMPLGKLRRSIQPEWPQIRDVDGVQHLLPPKVIPHLISLQNT
jgi:hypothetical protein